MASFRKFRIQIVVKFGIPPDSAPNGQTTEIAAYLS
jgi:hypothetical protein